MSVDLSILDALPDALFLVDGERIAWASNAAAEMLGTTTLEGRSMGDLLVSGEWERLKTLESQHRAGWEVPQSCRLRFRRLDNGAEATVDVRVGRTNDPPECILLSARDVTEMSRAEQLVARLGRLPAEGGTIMDPDGLLDAAEPIFRALGWMAAFTEIVPGGSITRRMIASMPGNPVGDYGRSLIGRFMPLEETVLLAEVVKTGKAIFLDNLPSVFPGPRAGAIRFEQSMTEARIARSAWCPVYTEHRLTHLLTVAGADLTEHDLVALQLFAAQLGTAARLRELRSDLVSRERLVAVGEMAAVMAHEVRNPVGIILNATSGLSRLVGDDEDAKRLLRIVGEEAQRLRRLVTDLLGFARPGPPRPQPVQLAPMVREALQAVLRDPARPTRAFECVCDMPPDLVDIEADPLLLRRVLINMLLNATQHVPEGGTIRVSAAQTDGEVCMMIYNDGPPIAPEVAGRIFEPFFTSRPSGTGLGLTVVRDSLAGFGGQVELEPTEDGVQFSVRLRPAGPHTPGMLGG